MPTRDKQKPRRYYRIAGEDFVSFRFGLYPRQKRFLDEYSARLGACRSAILREALDTLIERWTSDIRFKPTPETSDRDWFGDLIRDMSEEREKEIDAEMEAFAKELEEERKTI